MRPFPPTPLATWDFEINAVPGALGQGEPGLIVSRPDFPGLFILNASARFIWTGFQVGEPQHFLAERFAEHFGIPFSQASSDVASTFDAWSETLLSPIRATQSVALPPLPPANYSFSRDYSLGSKHFRLLTADPDFVEEIAPRLAHLAAKPQSPDFTFSVFRQEDLIWVFSGEAFLAAEPLASTARTILLEEMARLAHPGADWLAILHAAACANNGECIILPAATNSGKSTLTAALMHSGLQILSDDSAPLDRQSLQIYPLPFALMLREGSWKVLERYFPQLSAIPTQSRHGDHVRFLPPPSDQPADPAKAKCLVFVQFEPGAEALLQPLTPFESLLGLQKSGFWVPHNRESIGAFLAWYQSLPAYELRYSDLSEAVRLIHSLFE
jgi:hypothetical protein